MLTNARVPNGATSSRPLEGDPAVAWFEVAKACLREGRSDEAIAALDKALHLRPAFPEALRVGAGLLRDRGALDAALRFLTEAIRLQPTYLDAIFDKGNLLHVAGLLDEALATFDAALSALPNHAGLLCNKGATLHSLGRLREAEAALESATAVDPLLPQAHLNRAGVLMRMFRHAEALPLIDRAIALQPVYAAAHANRGLALKMLGRFAEAEAALDVALAQEPANPYALTNRGELRLLLGDYERGLIDYQARLQTEWQNTTVLVRPVPFWTGEALNGLRVVLVADAGYGDVIHFCRYVPGLVAAGADVTVICRPRLHRLLASLLRGTRVLETDDGRAYDCFIPFSNLPYVCATTRDTIPGETPYLLAEPSLVGMWRERLGDGGFKVGLCWRGNQDWRTDPHRSIPIDLLAPLAEVPTVRLISLHPVDEEASPVPFALEHLAGLDSGPDAFVDTAALMASLDLVITIDTSIAHLAGALARPTALLLRKVPEWRWMLNRQDTPWYPTIRLFRQDVPFCWASPVSRLVAEVSARAEAAS